MKKKDILIKKICYIGEGFVPFKKLVEFTGMKNINLYQPSSREIPKDYDIYILHLSEISLNDLKELRKKQPWSWIYGHSGGSHSKLLDEQKFLMEELDSLLDGRYHVLPSWMCRVDKLKIFLEEIKHPRKNGEQK